MCENPVRNRAFGVSMTALEIESVFPSATEVFSRSDLFLARANGLFILNEGAYRSVNLKGYCPFFKNGNCEHEGGCVWKDLLETKP